MHANRYEIECSDSHSCWAELQGRRILIHRTSRPPAAGDEVVLEWDADILRNLLSWAGEGGDVNAAFTGPMAHQIREHSRELGMTPEMFVWHAVKVFIEVGAEP